MAHDQGQVTPGPDSLAEDLELRLVGTGRHRLKGPASAPCLHRRRERSPQQGREERPGEEGLGAKEGVVSKESRGARWGRERRGGKEGEWQREGRRGRPQTGSRDEEWRQRRAGGASRKGWGGGGGRAGGRSGRVEAHGLGLGLARGQFRQLLQPLLQLQRELLIASLTHRLHVELHKLVPAEEVQQSGEPPGPTNSACRGGAGGFPWPLAHSSPGARVSFWPGVTGDKESGLQASFPSQKLRYSRTVHDSLLSSETWAPPHLTAPAILHLLWF